MTPDELRAIEARNDGPLAHRDIPRLIAALREAWAKLDAALHPPCPVCGNEERHNGTGALTCECPDPAVTRALAAEAAAAEMREALQIALSFAEHPDFKSVYDAQQREIPRDVWIDETSRWLDAASPTPGAALLAERDRLREALADALRWFDGVGYPRPSDLNARSRPLPTWTLDARAALKETSNG